jgi:hypothetical protein
LVFAVADALKFVLADHCDSVTASYCLTLKDALVVNLVVHMHAMHVAPFDVKECGCGRNAGVYLQQTGSDSADIFYTMPTTLTNYIARPMPD